MKSPTPIQITIAKPCTQDWNAMSVTPSGRYCTQCDHTVIDFAGMSDAQMLQTIAAAKGKVCGRFRATQLDRPMDLPWVPQQRVWPRIALSAFLMMAAMPHSLLSQMPPMAATYPTQADEQELVVLDGMQMMVKDIPIADANLLRLRIRVLDERTSLPMPFARISVNGIQESGYTDTTGVWELAMPTPKSDTTIGIMASAREYLNSEIEFKTDTLPEEVVIYIKMETILLGGIFLPTRADWKQLSRAEKIHWKAVGVYPRKKLSRQDRKWIRSM